MFRSQFLPHIQQINWLEPFPRNPFRRNFCAKYDSVPLSFRFLRTRKLNSPKRVLLSSIFASDPFCEAPHPHPNSICFTTNVKFQGIFSQPFRESRGTSTSHPNWESDFHTTGSFANVSENHLMKHISFKQRQENVTLWVDGGLSWKREKAPLLLLP